MPKDKDINRENPDNTEELGSLSETSVILCIETIPTSLKQNTGSGWLLNVALIYPADAFLYKHGFDAFPSTTSSLTKRLLVSLQVYNSISSCSFVLDRLCLALCMGGEFLDSPFPRLANSNERLVLRSRAFVSGAITRRRTHVRYIHARSHTAAAGEPDLARVVTMTTTLAGGWGG